MAACVESDVVSMWITSTRADVVYLPLPPLPFPLLFPALLLLPVYHTIQSALVSQLSSAGDIFTISTVVVPSLVIVPGLVVASSLERASASSVSTICRLLTLLLLPEGLLLPF